MKVEIYADIVCPWCYIGELRFERALAAFPAHGDVDVVLRPYQLDPTASTTSQPLAQYLTRRFGALQHAITQGVSEAAAAEGIVIDWDRAIATNTRTAHRLLRLALHEYGAPVQRELMRKLFDAHFTKGVDIGDHSQLAALAQAAGMERTQVQDYLASDEGERELEAELTQARALGIDAVPTFVFEQQYAVQGAQSPQAFLQVLHKVAGEAPGVR